MDQSRHRDLRDEQPGDQPPVQQPPRHVRLLHTTGHQPGRVSEKLLCSISSSSSMT